MKNQGRRSHAPASTLSRRELLRVARPAAAGLAILACSSVEGHAGILPSISAPEVASSPEAVALQEELAHLSSTYRRTSREVDDRLDATPDVEPPEELFFRPGDPQVLFGRFPVESHVFGRRWYGDAALVDMLRADARQHAAGLAYAALRVRFERVARSARRGGAGLALPEAAWLALKREHAALLAAAGPERFVLDRLCLDDDAPMRCEVERVREALGRVAEL